MSSRPSPALTASLFLREGNPRRFLPGASGHFCPVLTHPAVSRLSGLLPVIQGEKAGPVLWPRRGVAPTIWPALVSGTPLSPQGWEAQSWGRAGRNALPAAGRRQDLRLLTLRPGGCKDGGAGFPQGHSATPRSVAAWPSSAGPCGTRPCQ